jgi:hypothetical protein
VQALDWLVDVFAPILHSSLARDKMHRSSMQAYTLHARNSWLLFIDTVPAIYHNNATLGQKSINLGAAQIFEIKLKNLPNLSNRGKFLISSTCRFIGAKWNKKPNISILPKFSNGSKFKSRPAQSRKWMKLNIGQNSAQSSRWYGISNFQHPGFKLCEINRVLQASCNI